MARTMSTKRRSQLKREVEAVGKKMSEAVSRVAKAIGLVGGTGTARVAGRKGGEVGRVGAKKAGSRKGTRTLATRTTTGTRTTSTAGKSTRAKKRGPAKRTASRW